jgi:hypothetical protein
VADAVKRALPENAPFPAGLRGTEDAQVSAEQDPLAETAEELEGDQGATEEGGAEAGGEEKKDE